MKYVGVMTGTSVDGLDIAVLEVDTGRLAIAAARTVPIPANLTRSLTELAAPGTNEIDRLGIADATLGEFIGHAVRQCLASWGIGVDDVRGIGSHGQQHGPASHWEVWMYAEALGPLGALEVASMHGAHILGLGDELGSVTPGKWADLMVLGSNPLDDIENTLDIDLVMKDGVVYDAETLNQLWPEERPFGSYYWVNPDIMKTDTVSVHRWRPGN